MKKLFSGKRWGKTYQYLLLAHEFGYQIVCFSKKEAERVKREAYRLGLNIKNPVSYEELVGEKSRGRYRVRIIIDNADQILHNIFYPHEIEAITLTDEEI